MRRPASCRRLGSGSLGGRWAGGAVGPSGSQGWTSRTATAWAARGCRRLAAWASAAGRSGSPQHSRWAGNQLPAWSAWTRRGTACCCRAATRACAWPARGWRCGSRAGRGFAPSAGAPSPPSTRSSSADVCECVNDCVNQYVNVTMATRCSLQSVETLGERKDRGAEARVNRLGRVLGSCSRWCCSPCRLRRHARRPCDVCRGAICAGRGAFFGHSSRADLNPIVCSDLAEQPT